MQEATVAKVDVTIGKSTVGKSITLTREDVINSLKPLAIDILRDSIDDLINIGDSHAFNTFKSIGDKSNEDLANLWCELVSDVFLDNNPDIEDVLMLIDNGRSSGAKEKIWLASK